MSDNLEVSGAKYRVYSTGFMGSDSVALTPEIEVEHNLTYGVGLMHTSSNMVKHRTCVKTNELKQADHDILSNVFLYDQMVSLALKHFGPNMKDWIMMHDSKLCRESTLTTAENVSWMKETLEYVGGIRSKRVLTASTWMKLVNSSGTLTSLTVERQLHDTIKKLPYGMLKTNLFLQEWAKKPGGVIDMRDSLFIMYGQI